MDIWQKQDVGELIGQIEDVLDLDDEELMNLMKDDPESFITLFREGYFILHSLLSLSLEAQED